MNTWALRAIWITLPVTAGGVAGDAIRVWSDAPRLTAAILLWCGWSLVITAILVPRPLSLTITRIGTPLAVTIGLFALASSRPSTPASVVAVIAMVAAVGLGTRGEFARRCAQGAAYGDEERFPLKVPPGVVIGVLPFAITVIGAAIAIGPLLLADRQWIAGAIAVVVLVPGAVIVARLIHQLSCRWIVLVPAGLVVADPLNLTDPVLFVRHRILGLGPADPQRKPPDGALDLRLGAAYGSCALLLSEDADIMRRVRTRGVGVQANLLIFTPTAHERLLTSAAARRIHVRTE